MADIAPRFSRRARPASCRAQAAQTSGVEQAEAGPKRDPARGGRGQRGYSGPGGPAGGQPPAGQNPSTAMPCSSSQPPPPSSPFLAPPYLISALPVMSGESLRSCGAAWRGGWQARRRTTPTELARRPRLLPQPGPARRPCTRASRPRPHGQGDLSSAACLLADLLRRLSSPDLTITGYVVHDVRFPTNESAAGTDAMVGPSLRAPASPVHTSPLTLTMSPFTPCPARTPNVRRHRPLKPLPQLELEPELAS